ncbi:hypothetical protein P20495_0058 [Pseudoalteromonas sp. BSi20495]|nr:hypothetical protein P20495_0058 [Pseudoalteromonas sp. BSi20495]
MITFKKQGVLLLVNFKCERDYLRETVAFSELLNLKSDGLLQVNSTQLTLKIAA